MSMANHVSSLIIIFLALNFTHILGLQHILSTSFSGRVLAESKSIALSVKHSDDTVRVDPLKKLKKYRGGYDIRNKHYWSSAAFTGIHGYAIGVIWLICGLIFLVIKITCNKRSCRKLIKNEPPCLKECFVQPIILLAVFFTILAIIACGLVLGGDSDFHSRAKIVVDVIIKAAENATEAIYSSTTAMKEIKSYLTQVDSNSKAIEFLTSTSQRLDSQASVIETQTHKNRGLVDDDINLVYIITTVMISLTIVIVLTLLVFNVLKFHRTAQVLLVFCWIFTALAWFFFGAYFVVQKQFWISLCEPRVDHMNVYINSIVDDTCTAIEGFQKDPYNNSFSPILPCDQLLLAKPVLTDVKAGIFNLVNKVNWNISTSYGDIFRICNPFSPPPLYDYQPWNCPPNSKQIGEVPKILKELACPDSLGEASCNGGILIPDNYYNTVEAYCSSIQTLLNAYPRMVYLMQCQTVKDAFAEILDKHCGPLKKHLRMVWISLLFLSLVLLILVVIWVVGADQHDERNRHHSSTGSASADQSSL